MILNEIGIIINKANICIPNTISNNCNKYKIRTTMFKDGNVTRRSE